MCSVECLPLDSRGVIRIITVHDEFGNLRVCTWCTRIGSARSSCCLGWMTTTCLIDVA